MGQGWSRWRLPPVSVTRRKAAKSALRPLTSQKLTSARSRVMLRLTPRCGAWSRRGCSQSAAFESGGIGPVHIGGPTGLSQQPDDGSAQVDLLWVHTVPGAGGVGVVHVVPTLPEGQQREWPEVGRAVVAAGAERALDGDPEAGHGIERDGRRHVEGADQASPAFDSGETARIGGSGP
jgi:hypothetical protein